MDVSATSLPPSPLVGEGKGEGALQNEAYSIVEGQGLFGAAPSSDRRSAPATFSQRKSDVSDLHIYDDQLRRSEVGWGKREG